MHEQALPHSSLDINKDLIVSETALSLIGDTHFNPHSWHVFDKHIDAAVKIITDTLYNLYQKGIIAIELKRRELKVAQVTVFKMHSVYVKLATETDTTKRIGWLEKELILELTNRKSDLLKKVTYDVLNRVFRNRQFINPGKYFFLEALKRQTCKFYSYRVESQFKIEGNVEVWQESDRRHLLESFVNQRECEAFDLEIDREVVRKIVKKQLLRFQDL